VEHADYVARFRARAAEAGAGGAGLEVSEYGAVIEGGKRYPLLKLTLLAAVPGRPRLTVTSGFHGEEPAGPLALLEGAPGIVAHARARGVGLTIYPCANPSGFEDGTRYNRSGERPNNDFLRYEVAPGVLRGEIGPDERFERWVPFAGGPKETRALLADLERDDPPAAALDIHQDADVAGPHVYAYIFGDRAAYRPLLAAAARHAPIAAGRAVGAGGATDAEGFIVSHDGSVSDYLARRGARHVAAVETSVDTPLAAAIAIDLIWVRGFIDLAATSAPAAAATPA